MPTGNSQREKKPMYGLIYFALFLSGILLLADAFDATYFNKWTAKWGIVLIYSAFALVVGNGRKAGFVAVGIMWVTLIGSYLI